MLFFDVGITSKNTLWEEDLLGQKSVHTSEQVDLQDLTEQNNTLKFVHTEPKIRLNMKIAY